MTPLPVRGGDGAVEYERCKLTIVAELTTIHGLQHRENVETPLGLPSGVSFWRHPMRVFRWLRRRLLRALIGKMEVCTNMTIVNGSIEYDGQHGGVIVENIRFVQRAEPAVRNKAAA